MSENKKSTAGTEETDPAATMGLQMYRDLNMSSDAVIHLSLIHISEPTRP